EKYESGFGLCVAGAGEVPLLTKKVSNLYLDFGAGYYQKSYMIDRTDTFSGLDEQVRNEYIQAQVGVSYRLPLDQSKNWGVFISAGGYGGYWAAGHIIGNVPNLINPAPPFPAYTPYNEAYTFYSRRDNRLEFGWQA